AGPRDDMRVGQWPRVPLHRTPSSISRAFRQKHRSPEPDCPRRSSLPGIPETASLGPDQSPQRSASSDPSANGVGIIPTESNNQMRFHTVTVKIGHCGDVRCTTAFPHEQTFAGTNRTAASCPIGDIRPLPTRAEVDKLTTMGAFGLVAFLKSHRRFPGGEAMANAKELLDSLAIREIVENWALLADPRRWDRFR